jgi:thiamine pyridinylase
MALLGALACLLCAPLWLAAACGGEPGRGAPATQLGTPASGSSVTGAGVSSPAADASSAGTTTLRVAIFPWVPRPRQFEAVIAAAWSQRHPDVPLRFVTWDCYSSDPREDLDVFVFDAVFLDYFRERGFLEPLAAGEIEQPADILPYAMQAARSGDTVYGVPQLGCTSLLFFRRGDRALEAARDLGDVVAALGEGTYASLKAPRGRGLLVDLSDPTADGCLYLDALVDNYGVYTPDPPLAPSPGKVDRWAVANVRTLLHMASRKGARYASPDQFARGEWFAQGRGRALIGYAENLSAMGDSGRETVALKLMPLSDRRNIPLFYADLVGVNSAIGSGATRALAVELANLMASEDVVTSALGPWRGDDPPQYIFPVRHSVLGTLAARYPLYRRMEELIEGTEIRPFRLGADSRHWFDEMSPTIKRQVFATP